MNFRLLSILVVFAFLLIGCVTTGKVANLQPGEKPDIESDEAGIWLAVGKAERRISTSGHRLRDAELETYANAVLCRVIADYCKFVRVYLMTVPNFNASMMPNGTMQIWTGLLLRARNEAQLAFVLGHEFGHYLRRHSIQSIRDTRNKLDALAVFQIALAPAGLAGAAVGSVAALAAVGTIYSFSRDMEREADDIGFELAVSAGYDPREAAEAWKYMLKERDAGDDGDRSAFFATHPAIEERIDQLTKAAEESKTSGETESARYLAKTVRFRNQWLRDEVRKNVPEQTQALLDHLFEQGEGLGELHYYQGELYRRSDDADSERRAAEAYERALATGTAPAVTHRALGLLQWNFGNLGRARAAFVDYLKASPEASDREIIKSYVQEIEGQIS